MRSFLLPMICGRPASLLAKPRGKPILPCWS